MDRKLKLGIVIAFAALVVVPTVLALSNTNNWPSKTAQLRAEQAELDETLSQLKLEKLELEASLNQVNADIEEVRKMRDELEKQIVEVINSPLTTAPVVEEKVVNQQPAVPNKSQ